MGKTKIEKACDDTLNNVATKLLALREQKEMSRRDLSRASGVHEDALMKIEQQQRYPRIDTLTRLALALGVDVSKLFAEDA